MSVRDEAHRIAWSKVNHDTEPDGCATALRALIDEYDRLRAEWIDPQRIVDLAKRYTDENRAGKVEIVYYDHEPDRVKCWSVYRDGGSGRYCDGFTLDEVLKAAEA